MWFYVDKDRQQVGPVSVDELKRLLSTGVITKRTHLWQEGRAEWSRLEDLAASIGITLAAPPPTPAATMVMQAAVIPQTPSAPPMQPSAPPQPFYAAPPSFSAPNAQAPSFPAPNFPAPSVPAPNFPAPNFPAQGFPAPNHPPQAFAANQQAHMAQGYSPVAPAYPNVHAPAAASGTGSALKNFAIAFVGICVVGYYGYKYLGPFVPAISDKMAASALVDAAADLGPVRTEIESVYDAKNTCPGKELPIKAEIESNVFKDFVYGTIGEDNACALQVDIPKDFNLKQIAGSRILYVLRDGKWVCNMSAEPKFLPIGCNKIDATEE